MCVYVHAHCSMEGSVAKLREIIALKKKYKVSGLTVLMSSSVLFVCV